LVNGPEKAVGVKGIKQKTIPGIIFNIEIPDRIVDSSSIMGYRKRSVLQENEGMLALGRKLGFKVSRSSEPGEMELTIDLRSTKF